MTALIRQRGHWFALAALVGGFIATLPVEIAFIGGVVISFLILAALTPYSALLVLLILAPLRTLIATEASLQLPLDIGQLILLAVLAVWLLDPIVTERRLPRLMWNRVYVPLLLILGVTAPGMFTALSFGTWLTEWLKWLQILILAVVTINLVSGKQWQWLVFGLATAAAANAVVGLYEFFGGSGALHLLINDRFFRAFGTFGQPNPFGGFLGVVAPITMMMALGCGLRWWRDHQFSNLSLAAFYSVISLLLVAGIIASWSRGAWLALGGAIVAMLIALPRKLIHGLLSGVALVSITVMLWTAGLLPESVIARISSSTEEFFAFEDVRGVDVTSANYPVVERLAHWQAAVNMARVYPWFGVGLGNYEVAYPTYRLINWDEPLGHAHNFYLNMLAEGGFVGLLGYSKAWLLIMWLTWRARQHPDTLSRFVVLGLFGTWTYITIHSLFDNLYVNNLFLHIGLILGILGVLYNQVTSSVSLRSR